MQFLRGLNDQYANERQYSIPDIFHAETKQSSINVINAPTTTGSACAFCGRYGHTESTCYRKHGFPNHFDSKNSKSAPTRGKNCAYCGKTDHTIDVCHEKFAIRSMDILLVTVSSMPNSLLLTVSHLLKHQLLKRNNILVQRIQKFGLLLNNIKLYWP
ncbi:hypothetical protein V8G54_002820 [Vigna mungo]|uniref:CCHC-type domain-containing protein n=1 Tax=Vigna mungo TaxID=3915 RepID=A0AAQ3PAQ4_VIGMU